MPEKKTIKRVKKDKLSGKSASTQAGEFVREEMEHIREGKHGARSTKQAIAIGLSKARRAGIPIPSPAGNRSSGRAHYAKSVDKKGQKGEPISTTRSTARKKALEHEPRSAASHLAISRHAYAVSRSRSAEDKSRAAKQAAKTKGPIKRSEATKKGAKTRSQHTHE